MNQILLSFLCGAAFIGGATSVVVFVAMTVSLKDKENREKLWKYWEQSNASHIAQIAAIERIANIIEKKDDK